MVSATLRSLAVAMAFYFLTLQNYDLFNGYTGFNNVEPPVILGLDLGANLPFYYMSVCLAASCYFGVRHVVRTPFGLALQGVRDEPDRLRALGYNVPLLRVLAFGLAGFIAGIGGILNIWLNASISPVPPPTAITFTPCSTRNSRFLSKPARSRCSRSSLNGVAA